MHYRKAFQKNGRVNFLKKIASSFIICLIQRNTNIKTFNEEKTFIELIFIVIYLIQLKKKSTQNVSFVILKHSKKVSMK